LITNAAQHAFTSFAQDRHTGPQLSDAGITSRLDEAGGRKGSALGRRLLHALDQATIKLAGSPFVATSVLKHNGGRDSGNR